MGRGSGDSFPRRGHSSGSCVGGPFTFLQSMYSREAFSFCLMSLLGRCYFVRWFGWVMSGVVVSVGISGGLHLCRRCMVWYGCLYDQGGRSEAG